MSTPENESIRRSKFLSLILRHEPGRFGLKPDGAGWVGVTELLDAANRNGVSLTLEQLLHVVATNDKRRFAFSEDGQRIRASQGHSLKVIVDTCVWSRFLRRNRPAADTVAMEVARLVRSDAAQLLGPIRQELLSGAQPDERFEQLKEYLRFYPNLPLDEEDDETSVLMVSGALFRFIDRSGVDRIQGKRYFISLYGEV